jgi:hypothetical protein
VEKPGGTIQVKSHVGFIDTPAFLFSDLIKWKYNASEQNLYRFTIVGHYLIPF